MFIANHFFVRIEVSAYSNNQKNKFYSNYNNYKCGIYYQLIISVIPPKR